MEVGIMLPMWFELLISPSWMASTERSNNMGRYCIHFHNSVTLWTPLGLCDSCSLPSLMSTGHKHPTVEVLTQHITLQTQNHKLQCLLVPRNKPGSPGLAVRLLPLHQDKRQHFKKTYICISNLPALWNWPPFQAFKFMTFSFHTGQVTCAHQPL